MITINDIPAYAGLMYYDKDYDSIQHVKEAPFIHKNKLDFERVLCSKFYHYWLAAKIKIRELELEIEYLKK